MKSVERPLRMFFLQNFKYFSIRFFFIFLSSLISNELILITYIRFFIKMISWLTITLLIGTIFTYSITMLIICGILLQIRGIAHAFLDERWEMIIDLYKDNQFGPPSYIAREYFKDNSPEIFEDIPDEKENIVKSLYYYRNFMQIIVGALIQIIGTVLI